MSALLTATIASSSTQRQHFGVLRRPARTVEQQQAEVGLGGAPPRAPDTFRLGAPLRLAQPRRIQQGDGIPAEVEVNLQHVARGAGLVRHDRDVAPRQTVDQARLAGIRRPDHGDRETRAQPLAAARVVEVLRYFGRHAGQGRADGVHCSVRHVLLGREVDLGLDPGQRSHQLRAPALVEPAELAIELAQRLARLCRGLGRDQIGQPFRGGEVDPPVQEGAPAELAGLGRTQSGQTGEGHEERCHHGASAMHLQLEHVLAGGARRSREPQHEPLVDRHAARRIVQAAQRGRARFRRRTARQPTADIGAGRTRQPDHGDRAAAGCRRRREDRLGHRSSATAPRGWCSPPRAQLI